MDAEYHHAAETDHSLLRAFAHAVLTLHEPHSPCRCESQDLSICDWCEEAWPCPTADAAASITGWFRCPECDSDGVSCPEGLIPRGTT